MNAYSYTDIGGRSHNEDAVCIRQTGENQFLAVLADGLGGHGGGEIASEIAVETLENGWKGISSPAVLYDLILQAHRRILSSQTPVCRMRSTIVALSVGSGHADWAYAGDSRLYQFYNGELVYQTRDHSASQVAVLMGEITQDEIRFHKDRSQLFRALGQDGGLNVDTGSVDLIPGQYAFLLCSDGFWEYVYEQEMTVSLAKASSPKDWVEKCAVYCGKEHRKIMIIIRRQLSGLPYRRGANDRYEKKTNKDNCRFMYDVLSFARWMRTKNGR